MPPVSKRRLHCSMAGFSNGQMRLHEKLDNLTKCVHSMAQKLDDLAFIKSAVLTLLRHIDTTDSNHNFDPPSFPQIIDMKPHIDSVSNKESNSATESARESGNLALNNDFISAWLKTEPLDESNHEPEPNRCCSPSPLFEHLNESQASTVTSDGGDNDIDDDFDNNEILHQEPSRKPSFSIAKRVIPAPSELESMPQIQIPITLREIKLSDDERTLVYNVNIIFGLKPCGDYFGCSYKRFGAVVSRYRVVNNIAVLDQHTKRSKMKSIPNLQLLMYKEAGKRDTSLQGGFDPPPAFLCAVKTLTTKQDEELSEDLEYTCEVSVSEVDVGDSNIAVVGKSPSFKSPKEIDDSSNQTTSSRWWVLRYPSVIEQLKSKSYVDDFLAKYFDPKIFNGKYFKQHRFCPQRLAGPKQIRRKNYSKEERELLRKMIGEKVSAGEMAKVFNSSKPAMESTIRHIKSAMRLS